MATVVFVIAALGTTCMMLKVVTFPSTPIQTKSAFRTHWYIYLNEYINADVFIRDLMNFPVDQFPDIQSERIWKMERFCQKSNEERDLDPLFHLVLTVDNVLSQQECDWIIAEIEAAGGRQGWLVKRNAADTTTGLDVRGVDSLSYFAMTLVYSYIIPIINTVRGPSTPSLCGVTWLVHAAIRTVPRHAWRGRGVCVKVHCWRGEGAQLPRQRREL